MRTYTKRNEEVMARMELVERVNEMRSRNFNIKEVFSVLRLEGIPIKVIAKAMNQSTNCKVKLVSMAKQRK